MIILTGFITKYTKSPFIIIVIVSCNHVDGTIVDDEVVCIFEMTDGTMLLWHRKNIRLMGIYLNIDRECQQLAYIDVYYHTHLV